MPEREPVRVPRQGGLGRAVGETLAAVGQSYLWWLGDWWAYGEHRYGEREAIVGRLRAEGRKFPAFQTCANCGSVARAYETSRRREVLSFGHHEAVAALPVPVADRLLAIAEERRVVGPALLPPDVGGVLRKRRLHVG